jgi:hypothetical protein
VCWERERHGERRRRWRVEEVWVCVYVKGAGMHPYSRVCVLKCIEIEEMI